jgi:uncharacterized membrane protein YtjA (UPF0391 family)
LKFLHGTAGTTLPNPSEPHHSLPYRAKEGKSRSVAWNGPIGAKLDQRQGAEAEEPMTLLKWALIFFLVSVVAGILGFTGISAASADIARLLFYIFVVIFLVLLILGLTVFRV